MKKLSWKTEKRLVKDLIPYEKNPRRITKFQKQKLTESLEQFDLVEIPAIDTDNKILAGHQRINVLSILGHKDKEIDVRVPNRKLTDEEFKTYNLISNKVKGEWDEDLLIDYDKDLLLDTGWNDEEVDDLFPIESDEKDDEIPEVPKKPKSKLGEIYQLGKHRIMCGDSTKIEDVEKLMDGKKADMVFTDPPYNINVKSITFKTKILNDNLPDFKEFLNDILTVVWTFSNGSKYICFDIREKSFIEEFYNRKIKSLIVWGKDIAQHHRENYGVKYELIAYFEEGDFYGKNEENLWSIKSIQSAGSIDENGDKWFAGGSKNLSLHPTQKPIELISRAINNSSKADDIVMDLFLGSGSTLIACEKTNRVCFGMELDPKYIDVIIERWEKFTGEKAKKL